MRAVVTRERGRNASVRAWLPPDWEVDEVPATATRYEDPRAVAEAVARVGPVADLVVTSARAARYAPGCAAERVLAVGESTARALESAGRPPDVVGEGGAADLAARIATGPVLVLGARHGRRELVEALAARGVAVGVVECYETVPAVLEDADRRRLAAADVVVVGAPSAWAVVRDLVDAAAWVVVPGETTRAAVEADHARVVAAWGDGATARLAALAPGRGAEGP